MAEEQTDAEQLEDLQAIFDMRWYVDMCAIKRWQDATGRNRTWPDHTDMVVWLLERLEEAEATIVVFAALSANTKFSKLRSGSGSPGRK